MEAMGRDSDPLTESHIDDNMETLEKWLSMRRVSQKVNQPKPPGFIFLTMLIVAAQFVWKFNSYSIANSLPGLLWLCLPKCESSETISDYTWVSAGDSIVISGVSCRFPESNNMEEFEENLFGGVDMVTEDDRRWTPGAHGMPRRSGKIKDFETFDAGFFGIPGKQVGLMDPQVRKLLEVCYEAILDAGMNPTDMRGSTTGVFVGSSGSETLAALTQDLDSISGYTLNGCAQAMFANRLSYAFDFRGPSFAVDTACNSSLLAFQLAMTSMRAGQCEAALVCGANATLTIGLGLVFHRLGVTNPEGMCKSFDISGTGYAKAEGIGAVLLLRSSVARRVYATVLHSKSNTDGYTEEGINYPSGSQQTLLLEQVYEEAGVDPGTVTYVEAHGTGTRVGDPQEVNAITDVLCKDRKMPLLMGSVKSNMGHAEPASGVASLAKTIIAMERGLIPPNLHFNNPNPDIPALLDGRIKVISEATKWKGGLVGINSFGFGGANTHVLIRSHEYESKGRMEKTETPTLVCYSGRTKEGVERVLGETLKHAHDAYFHSLLREQSATPLKQFPYRGFTIFNTSAGTTTQEIEKISSSDKRPVWFVMSGMGAQWSGMGQKMMEISSFRESVQKSSEYLRPLGLDPFSILMTKDAPEQYNQVRTAAVCNTVIQLALVDVLKELGVTAEGVVGHSTGEIGCGYVDNSLTREQSVLVAYHRGDVIQRAKTLRGGMAAVGLGWEETKRRLPPSLTAACHNGQDSVTVSGPVEEVAKFVKAMEAEGIFAKEVASSGIAFHSPTMMNIKEELLDKLKKVIPTPFPRSRDWISSSTTGEEEWGMNSAEYHAHNVVSPVLFYDAIRKIPSNAIVVEIAPHGLLQSVLRRNVPQTCTNISLMKKGHQDNALFFLSSLGKLYMSGVNVQVEYLYPRIHYPVPRGTPMIGHLMRWDHSKTWPVYGKYNERGDRGGTVCHVDPFNVEDQSEKYLLDHVIDGRALYPFTGYLVLVWKSLCKVHGTELEKTNVEFTDIRVLRPIILTQAVKIEVQVLQKTGIFEISEGESVVAKGKIRLMEEDLLLDTHPVNEGEREAVVERSIVLETEDVYKTFQLRGYEYGAHFQGIHKARREEGVTELKWTGNWVTFLDTLLQSTILAEKEDFLKLPVRLRRLTIHPTQHLNSLFQQDGLDLVKAKLVRETMFLSTGGVEMEGLTAQTAARRSVTRDLYLEEYLFVPHKDTNCFKSLPVLRQQISDYRSQCRRLAGRLVTQWRIKGCPTLAELDANDFGALQPTDGKTAKTREREKSSGNPVVSRLLQKLIEVDTQDNNFSSTVQELVAESLSKLNDDRLWSGSLAQRSAKPLVDIVSQNTSSHLEVCCGVEWKGVAAVKKIRSWQLSHPQMESLWTLLSPSPQGDSRGADIPGVREERCDLMSGEGVERLGKFTLVLLDRVLSRKSDPTLFLQKIFDILSEGSFALVIEVTSDFKLAHLLEKLSALCGSQESTKRPQFFSHDSWMETFECAGFMVPGFQTDPCLMTTVYLLRKPTVGGKNPRLVNVDDREEFSWLEPLKATMEEEMEKNETIWLTSSKLDSGAVGLTHCLKEENIVFNRFRCLANVELDPLWEGLDMEEVETKKQLEYDLVDNCLRNGQWGSFRHIIKSSEEQSLEHRWMTHAYINYLTVGDLNSLGWLESPNEHWKERSDRGEKEDLYVVYYSPINFRDVMLASGRLPADAVLDKTPDKHCLLGVEFSGRLEGDGRRVMGITNSKAMATTVVAHSEMVFDVPEKWTMEEAATVPIVYLTAYYALFLRGKLRRGEKVLIHSGSGGVGMAAISIALAHQCEVFTTVGNEEKKDFLRNRFPQLKARHFSGSRTTEFEKHIRKQTGGKGVNVVLNSLSEDKLLASVRCLAPFGRFLEIGKFDLANDSALGMEIFLKNVEFHGVVLETVPINLPHEWRTLRELFETGIHAGVVRPLPTTVFPAECPQDAFRFMTTGKHIGKVMVQMKDEWADWKVPSKVWATCRTYCHPQHIYLITGGLGGIGLQLTSWLIQRGAKKVILTSRSGVKTGYQQGCLKLWRESGAKVSVSTLDISDRDQCFQLVEQCEKEGPLGGIFHLALVLRDNLLENQGVQNFKETAAAKYFGTHNLDQATRKLSGSSLKWFVGFSSIVSGRGNAGQTAYGWANAAMERIIEKRKHDGFSGMSIQWGAIGDVGVILDSHLGDNFSVIGGTLPQRIRSVLNSLDSFLSWGLDVGSCFVRAETGLAGGGDGEAENIVEVVGRILGVTDISNMDPNTNLRELGLDSLMGMEIKQAVERKLNIVLSQKEMLNLTLNKLTSMGRAGKKEEREKDTADGNVDIKQQMMEIFK